VRESLIWVSLVIRSMTAVLAMADSSLAISADTSLNKQGWGWGQTPSDPV
jgi:hypothetical protein